MASAAETVRAALARPVVAGAVLLLVYVTLSFVTSPGGYLGTDTGAKVATLDHMVENDTSEPTVGYWAEEWDPEGDYHPLFDSRQNVDGEWVNVTTLPMLIAARPLYDLGGYRMALLLPMLGGVAAAVAARNIARRIGEERDGIWAFWIVGLGSPVAVYALDFWEHSIGAALMLWATALLLATVDDRGPLWRPLVAGVLLGASATMRAETFVVTLVVVGGTCLVMLFRRDVVRSFATGALTVLGFAGPWFANAALESDLGGNSRTSRVSTEAQREFWTETGERFEEALITWFNLPGFDYPTGVVLGVVVVVSILGAWFLHRRGEPRAASYALIAAGVVYVMSVASGLGFVSGALVASPVAVGAVWSTRSVRTGGFLLPVMLAGTVLTWTFQLIGGASPQWGGRYLLAPTLVFTVFGVVALRASPTLIRRTVLGFAFGITAFGLVWLVSRSHEVDEFFEDLAAEPEDVVISTNGFLVREGGPAYEDRLYLSIGRGADLQGAVDVVEEAGHTTFGVLSASEQLPTVDADEVGVEPREFLGVTLWYHRYEFP